MLGAPEPGCCKIQWGLLDFNAGLECSFKASQDKAFCMLVFQCSPLVHNVCQYGNMLLALHRCSSLRSKGRAAARMIECPASCKRRNTCARCRCVWLLQG